MANNKNNPTPHDHLFRSMMIFYSGAKPYTIQSSVNLFDLFENRELAKEILWQPYQLIDLSQTSDSTFEPLLHYGVLAQIMKYIHKYKKDILILLEQNIDKLREIDNSEDFGYIISIIRYCFVVGEVPDKNKLKEVIQRGLNKSGDEVMTFAEQLRTEGYQQGMSQGINRGKAEAAMNLLRQGWNIKIIAQSTELSIAQILELKNHPKEMA